VGVNRYVDRPCLALTLWARLSYAASSVVTLIIGAVVSGLCVEGWAWLVVMGMVGVTVLNAVLISLNCALNIGAWIGGMLLGADG